MAIAPISLKRHLRLKDPRINRCKRHLLNDIVTIAVCAVIGNANTWKEIAIFGRRRKDWFQGFLELPNGIPSQHTFERVFDRLDPQALQGCLLRWLHDLSELLGVRHIAIDGKTLRHSGGGKSPHRQLHLVSAWAAEANLTLGQVAVDEKSNEITAIPSLLELLHVKGALVSIDAMGCQKEIADVIRERKGDYILAVKRNQPTLYEQVEGAIDEALERDAEEIEEHQTVEEGHGRREARTYAIFAKPESVDPEGQWRDLSAVGIAIAERRDARGRVSTEARYYILSRRIGVGEFAGAVRGHWGIENQLHWQLDVSFREDECRVCRDHAPANLSVIRRFALGLLKRETGCKKGIAIKRLKCSGSDEYRDKVLFNC